MSSPLSNNVKRKAPPRSASMDESDPTTTTDENRSSGLSVELPEAKSPGKVGSPMQDVSPNGSPVPADRNSIPTHVVAAGQALHSADKVLVSSIKDHKLGLTLVWSDWTSRCVTLYKNGYLSYGQSNKGGRSSKIVYPPPAQFYQVKCKGLEVQLMGDIEIDDDDHDEATEEVHGLVIKCKTHDGKLDTYIRCVMSMSELTSFLSALMDITGDESLAQLQKQSLQRDTTKSGKLKKSTNTVARIVRRNLGLKSNHASVMRRATARAMDKYDRRTKDERIVAKRGAFRYLPVMGANDLIHGSVWFTIGSVGVMFTALFVIGNKYYQVLSDDDSTLTQTEFVGSWILLAISGLFSTLGSAAFVRAFHEDPPMRPLFTWYHLQNDELLASWFFVLACAPFVPYILIFLSEAESNEESLVFLVALVFAVITVLGTLLFVRACYPTDKKYTSIIPGIMKYVCCCASQEWRDQYFLNDWLGGSWFFYWATAFSCFCTVILFIYSLFELNSITMFVYGTSLMENFAFLLGSAYFVAGSYPEAGNHEEGESQKDTESDKVEPGVEHFYEVTP